MRIVSWNLWWRFGRDWQERQPRIVAALRELRADVVGLHEVWVGRGTSQAERLASELDMHSVVATPSLPPPPRPPESPAQVDVEVGVAVLSRWPVDEVREHRLPSANRPNRPPVALVATLGHPAARLHVVAACVEWEPAFVDDHLAQTRALAELVTDPALDGPLPVLLAADLNAAPETPQIRTLTDVMVDTWTKGDGDGVTLSSKNPYAPMDAREQIDRRIDYILARPGRREERVLVERAFVAGRPVAGLPPSDHYAVVADLLT